MRLGLALGYAPPGTNPTELVALAQEAERLGYESAWAAEAWGTDAVTVLAWVAATTTRIGIGSAVLQMSARTPAATAMTAATLDLMSGGRFRLGLGTSGPQVAEGWHGQPWGKPLVATREYVAVVRAALRREVVRLEGERYRIPYDGPGASGLGRPLKLMARPFRADLPILLASLRPRSVELAVEVADGWLPIFFSPERAREVFPAPYARSAFEIAPNVPAVVLDDLDAARDALRPYYALYVGGMGARGTNFYNELAARYGFELEAARIQELYLDGKHRDAAAAVPDALVDELSLVGPRDRVADRLDAWRESGATTLLVSTRDAGTLRALAELA